MAELMSEADIAIGAAGSTSWERCPYDLPSIILVLAENQITVAQMLAKAKAVVSLNSLDQLPQVVDDRQNWMTEIGKNCSKVLDGKGVERVIQNLESWPKRKCGGYRVSAITNIHCQNFYALIFQKWCFNDNTANFQLSCFKTLTILIKRLQIKYLVE